MDRLPAQVFGCKLSCGRWPHGTTEVETGSQKYRRLFWDVQVCNPGVHKEGSGGGTTFRDFLKLSGHTKLIPWPEIRAAAAERALDRQAW
eukprot:350242-Chlamydomonas_euryale.AAC.1